MNHNIQMYITSNYCCYPQLFSGKWENDWINPQYHTLLNSIQQNIKLNDLMKLNLIKKEYLHVYSLNIFTYEICHMIIHEMEQFIAYSIENDIPIARPNSMNNYGLILNTMGMKETLTDLQQRYLLPLSRVLYPLEGSEFTDHHTFIVSYDPNKDRSLDMHTDDSDVTWNICLGKEGFVGAGLTFCGQMAEARHRKYSLSYPHVVGRAIVHLGQQRHGADSIISGERHNLIMWCKNEAYRQSDVFEERMSVYENEEGPPDPQCLSYTHDRDYSLYKEYPKGKNPYDFGDEDEVAPHRHVSMPWCPPVGFGYPGIPSQNRLMYQIYSKLEEDRLKRENETDRES